MSQSLTNILVYTIFSTKGRTPYLRDVAVRNELFNDMVGILKNMECPPLTIGGVEDHVHILHILSRTSEPARVIKELKRCSTVWLKNQNAGPRPFAWQGGYGMFSLGISQINSTRKYILNQENHHRTVSFQDEFRRILKRHELACDKLYVWD